ncbi:MAG: DUF4249 domain-containing protein [Saprospiraceae bacterium]|nr:DUF4249 domain-containing protein [Saprospiraceae bacterium]MBK8854801.1 DUF4249 domain-containing protein [Saprospiraceae bacterium]MBK9044238.1 DUF4249 domain-containing protein [Saprospiraceae bacterium]MBP6694335.1 DUF4249 domain-containing protein [Saprospiraceae bacterium]
MFSCEVEYELESEKFVPKIVVNSLFTEGEPFVVNLTFSKDIFSNSRETNYIQNAKVFIKEVNTGKMEALFYDSLGNYTMTEFLPKSNFLYELKVLVPGYTEISASSKLPSRVSQVNIITENSILNQQQVFQVKFNIQDKNSGYYVWNWINTNKNNPLDSSILHDAAKFVKATSRYGNFDSATNFEANFGSKTNEEEFKKSLVLTNDQINDGDISNSEINQKYYLRIMSLSEEMFSFYISMDKYSKNSNQVSSISYLPNLYSNINNGLGLFGGYSQRFIEVSK